MSQYAVTNPATGEVVETFTGATDQQVQDAIAASAAAFAGWSAQPYSYRAERLKTLAELLRGNSRELAEVSCTEMGKPLEEMLEEIVFGSDLVVTSNPEVVPVVVTLDHEPGVNENSPAEARAERASAAKSSPVLLATLRVGLFPIASL